MLQLLSFYFLSLVLQKISFGLFEHFLSLFDLSLNVIDVISQYFVSRQINYLCNRVGLFFELHEPRLNVLTCVINVLIQQELSGSKRSIFVTIFLVELLQIVEQKLKIMLFILRFL
jgi:hypothetical protein